MRFRLNVELGTAFKVVGGATLLLVSAVAVLPAILREQDRQVRRFETWHIDGPACRPAGDPAAEGAPRKTFLIAGVRISREHGHMSCLRIREDGGRGPGELLACHMLSPGRIEVAGPGGTSRFDPGPGGPATILASDTSVRCVTRINPRVFDKERPYD
jgi:hypothetical protein